MVETSKSEALCDNLHAEKFLSAIPDGCSPSLDEECIQLEEHLRKSRERMREAFEGLKRIIRRRRNEGIQQSQHQKKLERKLEQKLERNLERELQQLKELISKVQREKERERERKRERRATMRSLQRGALRNFDATPTNRRFTHDIPPDIPDTLFEADFCSATVAVLRMALTPCLREHIMSSLNPT